VIFLFERGLRANASRSFPEKTGIHPRIKSEGMHFRIMLQLSQVSGNCCPPEFASRRQRPILAVHLIGMRLTTGAALVAVSLRSFDCSVNARNCV